MLPLRRAIAWAYLVCVFFSFFFFFFFSIYGIVFDYYKILVLSNEYCLDRLITLCELYISKEIDRHIANGIEKADINIVGLLLDAQQHNAPQLAKFLLHFISTNYQPMTKRKEFSDLGEENIKYVTFLIRSFVDFRKSQ